MTTIGQWLRSVADLPRLECELLLCDLLGISRAAMIAHPEQAIDAAPLQSAVAALRDGVPLAYVLGEREFWGLTFAVSPAVLIPRPETELLVELAARTAPADGQVLELGTGSGAIAVALAHERPDLQITAVELSAEALAVARCNAARHGADVRFLQGDWFDPLPDGERFALILSNPPYVAANDPHLPALHAEPRVALVSANEGMADLQTIVRRSHPHLLQGSCLMVEHGHDQAAKVRAAFAARGFLDIVSERDLAGIERVTTGRRP